jgi:hypothetical protein
MADFRYNKLRETKGNPGGGTLIGNWQEERELRDFTGIGRTIIRDHIPKKHLDFENPIDTTGKRFDNTVHRIYGEADQQKFNTNNTEYGTGKHSTAGIARFGRKDQMREAEI